MSESSVFVVTNYCELDGAGGEVLCVTRSAAKAYEAARRYMAETLPGHWDRYERKAPEALWLTGCEVVEITVHHVADGEGESGENVSAPWSWSDAELESLRKREEDAKRVTYLPKLRPIMSVSEARVPGYRAEFVFGEGKIDE